MIWLLTNGPDEAGLRSGGDRDFESTTNANEVFYYCDCFAAAAGRLAIDVDTTTILRGHGPELMLERSGIAAF